MLTDLTSDACDRMDATAKQKYLNAKAQELLPSFKGDFTAAFNAAKSALPTLTAALAEDRRAQCARDDAALGIPNDLSAVPQLNQDRGGLLEGCDMDEASAAWRSNRNSFEPREDGSGAAAMHKAIIATVRRKKGLTSVDAETDVRTRFKALSTLRDASEAAGKLAAAQPRVSGTSDTRINRGKTGPGPDRPAPPIVPRQTGPAFKAGLDVFKPNPVGVANAKWPDRLNDGHKNALGMVHDKARSLEASGKSSALTRAAIANIPRALGRQS